VRAKPPNTSLEIATNFLIYELLAVMTSDKEFAPSGGQSSHKEVFELFHWRQFFCISPMT
jgi:hypothetical protein